MRRQFRFFSLVLLAIMGITGCSSLPKQVEPRSLTVAQVKMNAARDAQRRQSYQRALQLYLEAYRQFTSIDRLDGKIHASLAIARQYFYLGKSDETDFWIKRASELIETDFPSLSGAKAVLQVEIAFGQADYSNVIRIAAKGLEPRPVNIEWHTELLCYLMVAKARLTQEYQGEFLTLTNLLPELEKRFRKQRLSDGEVLSLAYYYIGYIDTLNKKWREALHYFEKAGKIDGLLDNAYGVGKALYASGRCYEKLDLPDNAKSAYRRALEIFTLLNDQEMMKKTQNLVNNFD